MSVIELISFSVTLKTSSASSIFNDFAWPLLLYKQSSRTWSQQLEKKDNGFVYFKRTVQVECPVISLLSKNAMFGQTVPSIDEIYQ